MPNTGTIGCPTCELCGAEARLEVGAKRICRISEDEFEAVTVACKD